MTTDDDEIERVRKALGAEVAIPVGSLAEDAQLRRERSAAASGAPTPTARPADGLLERLRSLVVADDEGVIELQRQRQEAAAEIERLRAALRSLGSNAASWREDADAVERNLPGDATALRYCATEVEEDVAAALAAEGCDVPQPDPPATTAERINRHDQGGGATCVQVSPLTGEGCGLMTPHLADGEHVAADGSFWHSLNGKVEAQMLGAAGGAVAVPALPRPAVLSQRLREIAEGPGSAVAAALHDLADEIDDSPAGAVPADRPAPRIAAAIDGDLIIDGPWTSDFARVYASPPLDELRIWALRDRCLDTSDVDALLPAAFRAALGDPRPAAAGDPFCEGCAIWHAADIDCEPEPSSSGGGAMSGVERARAIADGDWWESVAALLGVRVVGFTGRSRATLAEGHGTFTLPGRVAERIVAAAPGSDPAPKVGDRVRCSVEGIVFYADNGYLVDIDEASLRIVRQRDDLTVVARGPQ